MTTDVRLTSGLTRTVFFIFLWRESIFLGKKMGKKMKKSPFFSEKRATRRQRRHSICLPYTAGGMHSEYIEDWSVASALPSVSQSGTHKGQHICRLLQQPVTGHLDPARGGRYVGVCQCCVP